MASKLEIMQELDRRGKLPPEKKALFDEAVRRGLVGTKSAEPSMMDQVKSQAHDLRANQAPVLGPVIEGLEAGGGLSPEEEAAGWERNVLLPRAVNPETGEAKLAVPGALMGVYDAFKLPGDVAAGKVDPMSDEGIARGVGFAAAFTPGAPGVAKPPIPTKYAKVPAAPKSAIPTAAELKTVAQSSYDMAKGSEISAAATPALVDNLNAVLAKEGLVRPDGKLASTFGEVRTAMKDATAYRGKAMTFEQFQRLEEALQKVAGSKTPGEARIGDLMLDEMDKYFAGLADDAFTKGSGSAAKEGYAGGKAGWAQYSKLKRVEQAMSKAERAKGGFAEGLRSQFRTILNSESKSRGFTKEELAMMDEYVKGGKLEAVTGWLSGLRGMVAGGLSGGVVGAVGVPLVGAAAKSLGAAGAKKTASQLRASIAQGSQRVAPPIPPKAPFKPTLAAPLANVGTRALGAGASEKAATQAALQSLRAKIAGT